MEAWWRLGASDPAAAAKALGFKKVEPWMTNLRNKNLRNSALVAYDYQTGELVAYVGSANYYAAKSTPQFQPKFDVVGSGFRQPGSAFKPFNYLTGIDDKDRVKVPRNVGLCQSMRDQDSGGVIRAERIANR